jgi:hypothetical protein
MCIARALADTRFSSKTTSKFPTPCLLPPLLTLLLLLLLLLLLHNLVYNAADVAGVASRMLTQASNASDPTNVTTPRHSRGGYGVG